MKRNSLLIAILFVVTVVGAQTVNLHMKNGEVIKYNSTEVDYIDFAESSSGPVSYTFCPDGNHPHLIDLGLPSGTKWACCNVGAEKPEDYGDYFAWGETTEKSYYDWSNYIHCDGSSSTCHNIGRDIAGTQYDVATAKWGSPWVMPSREQIVELKNKCTSESTRENGVIGKRFTGPNGASIFLPFAGNRTEDRLNYRGQFGIYWTSSIGDSGTDQAWYLALDYPKIEDKKLNRYFGISVRPVRKN